MRAKPITRSSKSLRSYKMRTKSPPETEKGDDIGQIGDRSVLRSSIDTSVSNLYQLSKLFENGTTELCELLTNECSIIYECKVCRNLFRSVANFISHKRTYCVTKYVDMQEQLLLNARGTTITTRTTSRQDIISMLDGIIEKQPDKGLTNNTVVLKEMNSTSEGLINCSQQGSSSEKYATLGPDGRIVEKEEEEDQDASMCNVCQKIFPTQKSLANHIKLEHSNSKMYFVCPCCKKYFTNSWSVYRHLYKVHRKSIEQVRKLRPQIKRKQVKLSVLLQSRKSSQKSSEEKPYDQDKAWMEELEGNIELQRCLGCGKKFERRVALISHSQMCQKRLAIIQKLPKRRPPTPTKPEPDRKSRIQVRMYYDKVNNRSKELPEIISTLNSSEMESDFSLKAEAISKISPPTKDPFLPDKDVTDVVSRYRRDVDIHDKCRRLEAKLLQLHKVAVEEIEGSLSEKLPESHSSIQECIGTITPTKSGKENNEKRTEIEAEEETFDPPTFIVSTTSEISKTEVVEEEEEESHSATFIPEDDSQTIKNGNCSGISSCIDPDIIVIEDDDDYIASDVEITYISSDSNKGFQTTDEGDVTSTISIPNIVSEDSENNTDHTSETAPENCDSDSPISQNDSLCEENENQRLSKINACINKTLKKCLICYRSFNRLVQAKRHVALHFNIYKYRCKLNSCKFQSYLKRDLLKHMQRVHRKKNLLNLWYQRLDSDEDSDKSSLIRKLDNSEMNSGLSRSHKQNYHLSHENDYEINFSWERDLKLVKQDNSSDESHSKNQFSNSKSQNSSSDEEDDIHSNPLPLSDDSLKAQMMEIIFGTEDDGDIVLPQICFDEFIETNSGDFSQEQ